MYMRGSPERWQFTGTAEPHPPSSLAPRAREPGLPLARQALGPVVVRKLRKPRCGHKAPPGFQIVIRAVAPAVPALLVVAVRVRAEQNAARLERRAQLAEDARQLLARHVEQHRIGEHAVEARIGEFQSEQILQPHLAAAVLARHDREGLRALEADRDVAEPGERLQDPPRPATQIENCERRRALDAIEQRRDIPADVVIARALPEVFGAAVVVVQGPGGDFIQIPPVERIFHALVMLPNPGVFSYRCAPGRTPLQSSRISHPTEPMPDTASQPAPATVPSSAEWRYDRSLPRALARILALDDFEEPARRYLPRPMFGYVSGGSETNASLRANRAQFDEIELSPRVLVDVSGRTAKTT